MDKRSYQIKKILKEKFPNATFRVKIKKFSGGESINIYTDLIPELTAKERQILWARDCGEIREITPEVKEAMEKVKEGEEIRREIQKLVGYFQNIHYDEATGEILSGANTFLFIEAL